MPQNVYAQSFEQGQSLNAGGMLMDALARKRRDAIANQLLREQGFPGTGGEAELAMRGRIEQMKSQQLQREMQAQYRQAETERIQREQADRDQANKWADKVTASDPDLKPYSGGGVAGMNFGLKMKQYSSQKELAQQRLLQQGATAKQRAASQVNAAHAKLLALDPDEHEQMGSLQKQIDELSNGANDIHGQIARAGVNADELLGADSFAPNAAGDQLVATKGGTQKVFAPRFAADALAMDATGSPTKGMKGMGDLISSVAGLRDKKAQIAALGQQQRALYAQKIVNLAEANPADQLARQARSALGGQHPKDPRDVYRMLLNAKQFGDATASPAGAAQGIAATDPSSAPDDTGFGGGALPPPGTEETAADTAFGADPSANVAPIGYSPAAAAAGMDPEDNFTDDQ